MSAIKLSTALAHWVEHGFAILPGYMPPNELAPAQRELPVLFPTPDEFHDGVDKPRNAKQRPRAAPAIPST